MKRISLRPKRKVSETVRLLRSINRQLLATVPRKVKPPKPAPLAEQSKPGRCRSCGWAVPPKHEACARCSTVNLREAPSWVTAEVVKEQQDLNPGKTWPTPFKRYNTADAIRDFYRHN